VYSTYLGGSSVETATAIAVDGPGRAWVAGYTASTDFPAVNAVQTTNKGQYDGFVVTFGISGSLLEMSTFLGGSDSDAIYGIALSASGNAYVVGRTLSNDYPTASPAQPYKLSSASAFVTELEAPPALPPAILQVTPSGGSGVTQTFSLGTSDPNGALDISSIYFAIGAQPGEANGCMAAFDRASGLSWLVGDDGRSWLTAGALGSGSPVSNSQCTLDPAGSSAAASGTVLILSLKITFKPAFAGGKRVYALAVDRTGLSSGWNQVGAWTNPGASPPSVSVTPASGSGTSQTFSLVVTEPTGSANITSVYFLVGSSLTSANACQIAHDRRSNLIWLIGDNGTSWLGAGYVGSGWSIANSQCTLDASASSVSASGTTLTLNLKLSFKSTFSGTKNLYSQAINQSGLNSGWVQLGTWTNTGPVPPTVSLTPTSGVGATQIFSVTASDANGADDVASIYFLLNDRLSSVGACQVAYDRTSNLVWLIGDNGTTWLAAGMIGSGSSVSNTQCILNATASSRFSNGTALTLNLSLTLRPPFSGLKGSYALAIDRAGMSSGWQLLGTWSR
jgi:hypothetical protein